MRQHRVEITATAEAHIRAITEWWRANRESNIFLDELAQAFAQLAIVPFLGPDYPQAPGTRRLQLRRSRYHVYYTVDTLRQIITVKAVWHMSRGGGPPL